MPVKAQPVEHWCVTEEFWEFFACLPELGCDQGENCGESPEGERLAFLNSCLPEGWKSEIRPLAVLRRN